MTTQINLRFPDELLVSAKNYAHMNGYLNVQEFIRETVREKLFDEAEVREEYIKVLKSKEANTFLSKEESKKLDKELRRRAKL